MDSADIGKKGEDIVSVFLVGKGHSILHRNYRMKFGEIDVVSRKDGTLYFIEVKTVLRSSGEESSGYGPEERVNHSKMEKLSRVIEYYLLNECVGTEPQWEFWVVAVGLDVDNKKAFVKVIPETLSS